MKRAWSVLVVVACALVPGCLEPYRAHVDSAVVSSDWEVRREPIEGSTLGGRKLTETIYTFDPRSEDEPPYPGVLQVFSLRELSRSSTEELLRFTREAVEEAAEARGIHLNPSQNAAGERELRSGAETQWFTRGGTVETSDLFERGQAVRIVGEAWYDARSRTSVVAVGLAQVSGPGPLPFQTQNDETTWIRLVGDPRGSIGGATSTVGFLFNTVSHG